MKTSACVWALWASVAWAAPAKVLTIAYTGDVNGELVPCG
jgi:hypothetical protein